MNTLPTVSNPAGPARVVPPGDPRAFSRPTGLVFYHLPKCAGSTMNTVLEAAFPGAFHLVEFHRDWTDVARTAERPAHAVFSGDKVLGLHEQLPASWDAAYYAILRHPWGLCRSMYVYARQTYYAPGDFAQFLERYNDNELTRWLGNRDLDLAKERLTSFFWNFGLVERFDDSLRLLAAGSPIPAQGYVSHNVSGSKAFDYDPDLEAAFLQRNAQDLELYDFAARLFAERCAKAGVETAPRPEPAPGNSSRRVRKVTFDAAIIQAQTERRLEESARQLEERLGVDPGRDYDVLRALVETYRALGDGDALLRVIEIGNTLFNNDFLLDQARWLAHESPRQALSLLEAERTLLGGLACSLPDAGINRHLAVLDLERADILASQGRDEEALAVYRQVLAGNPANFDALVRLGDFLTSRGRHEDAAGLYSAQAGRFAGNLDAQVACRLSGALLRSGRPDEAGRAFNQALADHPNSLAVLVATGVFLRQTGRPDQAANLWRSRESGLLARHFPAAYARELAVALYEAGRADEAFAALDLAERADTHEPSDTEGRLAPRPMDAALAGARRTLVLRAGPWMALDHLSRRMASAGLPAADLLTPGELPPGMDPSRFARVFRLPPGMYNHATHRPGLDPEIFAAGYDAAVLVISRFEPEAYTEIVSLIHEIAPTTRYFFTFDQLFDPGLRDALRPLPGCDPPPTTTEIE